MTELFAFLGTIPPVAVYLVVGLLVGIESIGVPLPGETALVAAALWAISPNSGLDSWAVAAAGITGAIVGDSIGYAVGRRWGLRILDHLMRRFPRHVRPSHVAYARHLFRAYGPFAVIGGRFVALLRMLAGPLSAVLHLPYRRFLWANITGGILWAGGLVALVTVFGTVVEHWFKDAGWVLLGVCVVGGLISGRVMGRVMDRRAEEFAARRIATKEPDSANEGRRGAAASEL